MFGPPGAAGKAAVSVVIPAYEARSTVGPTVRAAWSLPGVAEVIVVDDGSKDTTARRARQQGARLVRFAANRGKGAALQAGVRAARRPILALVDADLGASAGELSALVEQVATGQADMAVAVVPPGQGGGGFGVAVNLARLGTRLLAGESFEPVLSGQRVLNRRALAAVWPLADRFGVETAMTVQALQSGLRVVAVPAGVRHRVTGWSLLEVLHRAGQARDILGALLAVRGARL